MQKHCKILRRKDAVSSLSQKEQVCGKAVAVVRVTSAVAVGVGMDLKGIRMVDYRACWPRISRELRSWTTPGRRVVAMPPAGVGTDWRGSYGEFKGHVGHSLGT